LKLQVIIKDAAAFFSKETGLFDLLGKRLQFKCQLISYLGSIFESRKETKIAKAFEGENLGDVWFSVKL